MHNYFKILSHKPYIERFGREHDFRVRYKLLTPEEGGRHSLAYQGIRWDFWYEDHPIGNLFMIYPEFEQSTGELLQNEIPIESEGFANMWILDLDNFEYHKKRITKGTQGTFNEGKPIANCEVVSMNFMKTITIKWFKLKHQNRVTFTKVLVEYNENMSLKPAKELLDSMLDGKSIKYSVDNHKFKDFCKQLDELNLEYEIKSG